MESKLNDREQQVRKHLIDLAHNKRLTSYQELSDDCDLGFSMKLNKHRKEIGDLLDKVSRYEIGQNRPILSAIVVSVNEKIQGDGFFDLCVQVGKTNNNPEGLSSEEKKELSDEMIAECYDFWSNELNYKNHYEI